MLQIILVILGPQKFDQIMNAFVLLLGAPGPTEIIIILIIVILLFGAKKIPELMKGVGKGIKEFKSATKNETADDKGDAKDKDGESNKISD